MPIKKLQSLKNKRGFTLVELIIVIAIIAVLAAILIPILMNYVTNSRISSADAEAKSVHEVLTGIVSGLEVQNETLPTETVKIDCSSNTYSAVCDGSSMTDVVKSLFESTLTSECPNLNGEIEIFFGAEGLGRTEGSIQAVVYYPGGNNGEPPVWTHATTTVPGHWSSTKSDRNRNNIYGCYPELPADKKSGSKFDTTPE